MKKNLLNYSLDELKNILVSLNEPAYRAKQIFEWMYKGKNIDQMSNIPQSLKEKLQEEYYVSIPLIINRAKSSIDGTVKYLFEFSDGQRIESVFMKYNHGNSVCISTQAGCRMGCAFCASTIGGKVRDLEAGEILSQVLTITSDTGERISNIVLMGIGEPLDNYDNVIRFLNLVGSPDGINIGYRHISLSTCGIVPNIYKLADEDYPITLSISLHAVSNDERDQLMPVNRKWGIEELLQACVDYFDKTKRRISFEYTLISGKNDDLDHARKLSVLLKKYFNDRPCHVNLIPVNNTGRNNFHHGSVNSINAFRDYLVSTGVNATVRRHLGGDIDASCGQLRNNNKQ